MPTHSQVSHIWQEPEAAQVYRTGVSLHSHTSHSLESLTFLHAMCEGVPLFGKVMAYYGKKAKQRYGVTLDFEAAHWRPPLVPLMAYELERGQILKLGLDALVSITDHDNIQAPLLLRTVPVARGIPVSVEWTAPFGRTAFHLGIHNLPSAVGVEWMERLARFTASPEEDHLHALLRELDAIPQTLIVFNHPLWDLYKIGDPAHAEELERFLSRNNPFLHAFELNGLRHTRENGAVVAMARRWSQTLISGGDRHGLEANANVNLTNATSFTEFVHEIRVDRRSHVLFLEQYGNPWEQRILDSTLDAICNHSEFSPGWQRWDERSFHADAEGVMRPMAQLWPEGRIPWALLGLLYAVRLFRYRRLAKVVSLIFSRGTLAERDGLSVREVA